MPPILPRVGCCVIMLMLIGCDFINSETVLKQYCRNSPQCDVRDHGQENGRTDRSDTGPSSNPIKERYP